MHHFQKCLRGIQLSFLFFIFSSEQILLGSEQNDLPPLPHTMAALGDSMTEGMLTDFSLEHPATQGQLLGMIETAIFSGGNLKAFRKKYANKAHSWSTGIDESDLVFSHSERLASFKSGFKSYNYAISGDESKDLPAQVKALLKTEREKNELVDYITVLIGANDLHASTLAGLTSALIYVQNVEASLRKILEVNPHRSILIMGIPDIHTVFEKSANLKAFTLYGKTFSCDQVRRTIYGEAVFFHPEVAEPYAQSKVLLGQYALGIQKMIPRLQQDYPAAAIKTVQGYAEVGKPYKDLSIDCFHPSQWGQAQIAEKAWQEGFWPDLSLDQTIKKTAPGSVSN